MTGNIKGATMIYLFVVPEFGPVEAIFLAAIQFGMIVERTAKTSF